jgi:hypothetical protein
MKNLSREELKNIFGGKVDAADAPNCNVGGACTLVTVYSDGTTNTESSTCSMSTWGSTVNCYCGVNNGGTTLTSNGGLSRCWG